MTHIYFLGKPSGSGIQGVCIYSNGTWDALGLFTSGDGYICQSSGRSKSLIVKFDCAQAAEFQAHVLPDVCVCVFM